MDFRPKALVYNQACFVLVPYAEAAGTSEPEAKAATQLLELLRRYAGAQ